MAASLRIAPDAALDIDRALAKYLAIRVELMFDLQDELDLFMEQISERPMSFQQHRRGPLRRAFMRQFPYGIFYLVDTDEVVVLAVMHFAEDPDKLQSRLNGAG